MSVLIKDMEMPESCEDCKSHCYHSNREYVCMATPLLYPFNLANSKGRRKDFCPLVEVPAPHGRLIDVDVLKKYIENDGHTEAFAVAQIGREGKFFLMGNIIADIDEQPTVIEAEEGENHDD